jgi:DNA-binding response OmpR family regulator
MAKMKVHGGTGKESGERPSDGAVAVEKKTILIFSPDLNLCFSLSMLFQDRFHVVTTTNLAMVEPLAGEHAADLLIVDAVPSERLIGKLDALRSAQGRLPVIMLYVYSARDVALDRTIRDHVDSVFYKPVEITAVSRRIEELLAV